LLFRFLTQQLNGHKQVNTGHKIEEIKQVAIVSILNYIGFALSIIVALLVAGFDFTALAIVAGALSVGIGLGLQSIVNNFVSGLILLIEKPIKPGDRIFIDGTEGCVKKISVRSTLIVTALKEDIIIPNSDLITKKVVNYTYQDRYLSILCDVPVSRDSDTQLVKELLLQVASSHADVINSTKNKPYVFFSSINEKSLLFQLSCLIKDAHNKSAIHSELNFAIYQQLKEHNIQLT
jgi:small-conductance mechanosensitive channel